MNIHENVGEQIEQNQVINIGDANTAVVLFQQVSDKSALDLEQHSSNIEKNETVSTNEQNSDSDEYETETNLTKKGENRKSIKFKFTDLERKAIKLNKAMKAHPVKT